MVAPVLDPDAKPGTTSFKGYYPLAIGNRWEYRREFALEFFPDTGAETPYWYEGPITSRASLEVVGDVEQEHARRQVKWIHASGVWCFVRC